VDPAAAGSRRAGPGVDHYPYGLLTMIVSLEAIFLSTFVMISQNRADEKRQVLADHQWRMVQQEEGQNEQLLQLFNQILELTKGHPRHEHRSVARRPERHRTGRQKLYLEALSIGNAMGDDQE
jgi:uncharacterized membrane protein